MCRPGSGCKIVYRPGAHIHGMRGTRMQHKMPFPTLTHEQSSFLWANSVYSRKKQFSKFMPYSVTGHVTIEAIEKKEPLKKEGVDKRRAGWDLRLVIQCGIPHLCTSFIRQPQPLHSSHPQLASLPTAGSHTALPCLPYGCDQCSF